VLVAFTHGKFPCSKAAVGMVDTYMVDIGEAEQIEGACHRRVLEAGSCLAAVHHEEVEIDFRKVSLSQPLEHSRELQAYAEH